MNRVMQLYLAFWPLFPQPRPVVAGNSCGCCPLSHVSELTHHKDNSNNCQDCGNIYTLGHIGLTAIEELDLSICVGLQSPSFALHTLWDERCKSHNLIPYKSGRWSFNLQEQKHRASGCWSRWRPRTRALQNYIVHRYHKLRSKMHNYFMKYGWPSAFRKGN